MPQIPTENKLYKSWHKKKVLKTCPVDYNSSRITTGTKKERKKPHLFSYLQCLKSEAPKRLQKHTILYDTILNYIPVGVVNQFVSLLHSVTKSSSFYLGVSGINFIISTPLPYKGPCYFSHRKRGIQETGMKGKH